MGRETKHTQDKSNDNSQETKRRHRVRKSRAGVPFAVNANQEKSFNKIVALVAPSTTRKNAYNDENKQVLRLSPQARAVLHDVMGEFLTKTISTANDIAKYNDMFKTMNKRTMIAAVRMNMPSPAMSDEVTERVLHHVYQYNASYKKQDE